MALTTRLEVRQSQALVMTPQLMQAIKLLQLSNLDLTTYVEGELERNPLLERTGDDEARPEGSAPAERDETEWSDAAERNPTPERASAEPDDMPPADADAVASRSNAEVAP